MQASELDKAVEFTKQFIEAATPIAKRAYEIGLVTLRIDAAQGAIFAIALLGVALLVLRRVRGDWVKARSASQLPENKDRTWHKNPSDHLPVDGALHFVATIMAVIASLISGTMLLNVWLWVKLLSPELWLAHRAVEKIIN